MDAKGSRTCIKADVVLHVQKYGSRYVPCNLSVWQAGRGRRRRISRPAWAIPLDCLGKKRTYFRFLSPASSLLCTLAGLWSPPVLLSATSPACPAPGIPSGDWYRNSQLRVSRRLISSRSFPRQTMRQWRAGGGLRKTAEKGKL